MVVAAVAVAALAPALVEVGPGDLIGGSIAYLLLQGAAAWMLARLPRARAQWLFGASLLLDGAALAWVTYATGGTQSPLRFLVLVHIGAVAVLASARTGLKVTAWHTLLFLVASYAQAADIVPVREAMGSALPGGPDFALASAVQVGAMWAVALAIAACSSINERELRAQKSGLAELSSMVRELDGEHDAAEIPQVLLDTLCRVFGFARGVVLAGPDGAPAIAASRGAASPVGASGVDQVTRRAWQDGAARLLPSLDPVADPNLDALLPGARNVLVVPLLVDRGTGLGVVALEHPGRRGQVKRWVVAIVERFASHAALTLHNAWLRERLERQLEENRALQQRLVEHNQELEVRVDERTRDLRKSLEDLRVADEQRRRLLAHLVHVEEEERRRIAGDVHDDPVQKMSAATMRIHVLRRTLSDPKQHEIADKVMASVRESIASLRNLIFELRPHALDEEGLGPALREYLESLDAGFEFRLDDRLAAQPAPELGVVLYRMAQEALANVRKHARATLVRVSLLEHEGGYLLRIADDGVGFESPSTLRSPKGHLGLTSLRERAEMAGGWCRLDSRPGRGTTVEAWLPGHPAPTGAEVPHEVEDPVGVAGPPLAAVAETASR